VKSIPSDETKEEQMKRFLFAAAILLGFAMTTSTASAGWAHRAYMRGAYGPYVVASPVFYPAPVVYAPAVVPVRSFYRGPMFYGAYPMPGVVVGVPYGGFYY
jgi:hypothetical protein